MQPPSGFEVSGAIDDLWQSRDTGKLIVADYKATAKSGSFGSERFADWSAGSECYIARLELPLGMRCYTR